MYRLLFLIVAFPFSLCAGESPLFRDFVGLCGHTVQFKPDLYAPVCRIVRDYHPVEWDLDKDTGVLPEWPLAKNRVSWEQVYGSWQKAGLRTCASLMIDNMQKSWKDMPKDAGAYAKAFAQQFGPGGKYPLVEWVEIGNEPGLYDDAAYRTLFEAMAKGIREGNPRMKILPCNTEMKSDRYWKGVHCLKGFDDLYDALQIHRYAIAEGWPVWRRSYPEDAKVPYLSAIQDLIHWRDANAKGKPVWVTEFGWDSSTKKPDPKGEWAKWIGSTDEEQARWTVRSFFLFARIGVEKAFVYFFNDNDEAKLHAASGLTRNFQPKPAYHAVAWMLRSLADYRFSKVLRESMEEGYAYEFTPEKAGQPVILAVWHPTKEGIEMKVGSGGRKVMRAERMPLSKEPAEAVKVNAAGAELTFTGGEKPVLLWMEPAR
ncbi:MAG TPA: hypothetical protein VHM91_21120 [Verrucomicrobiales bacterium]|nr:hypothetical protein [Verrucomicrobiales bacterium]